MLNVLSQAYSIYLTKFWSDEVYFICSLPLVLNILSFYITVYLILPACQKAFFFVQFTTTRQIPNLLI